MITENELDTILKNIDADYQGKPFLIFRGKNDTGFWVQVGTQRPCAYSGELSIGKSGKAYISSHATDDEIVKKVFGLCIAYVEHEMREGFHYKKKKLFNPHISLKALLGVASQTNYRNKK